MNLRTAALVIASCALCAGTALAQQDDYRNQDRQQRSRNSQPSRSDRNYRQDNQPRQNNRGNAGWNSSGRDNQSSRDRYSSRGDTRGSFGSWQRNPGQNSYDNRPGSSQKRAWGRSESNPSNRFNTDTWRNPSQDRTADRSSNRPGSNWSFGNLGDSHSTRSDRGLGNGRRSQPNQSTGNWNNNELGRFESPRQTSPDRNFFNQRGGNWSQEPRQTATGRNLNHDTFNPRGRFGGNRSQEPTPWRQDQGARQGQPDPARFEHVQGSHVSQPRPTFGRDWNFGRDKSLMRRNYENDVTNYNLQIVNNTYVYQRPEWGGHWREGYCGWGNEGGWSGGAGFHSGNFSFGFYLFTPFVDACYVSPWYYYTCLPPYIPADRCEVIRGYDCRWNEGAVYDYGQGRRYDAYVDENLDNAIGEIRDGFTRQDIGAIDGLISDGGRVAVFTDGHYDYSLDANDLHDMMADNIRNTETVDFEILSVRRSDRNATVRARHVVRNPDGDEEAVYQQYRLRNEDGRFVITDFMTSH